MWARFSQEYLPEAPLIALVGHEVRTGDAGAAVTARLVVEGEHVTVTGAGNGPVAAFVQALRKDLAIAAGSDASAAAYVEAAARTGSGGASTSTGRYSRHR